MVEPRRDIFLLERYKYVLSQKQSLNAATLQIMTIYQAGLVLVVSGQFAIVAAVPTKLDRDIARVGSFVLLGFVSALSIFALVLLGTGIGAWLAYRKEEAEIEHDVLGASRPTPTVWNAITWYETYFALGIIAVWLLYVGVLLFGVMPRLYQ
jgi:hypothetical protein